MVHLHFKVKFIFSFLLIFLFFFNNVPQAQSLTFSELNVLSKAGLDKIGEFLTNKNWKYNSHEQDDKNGYEYVWYGYSKQYSRYQAQAWFAIYLNKNFVVGIDYQFSQESVYKLLLLNLNKSGLKKDKTTFDGNLMKVIYVNKDFSYSLINNPDSNNTFQYQFIILKDKAHGYRQ